MGSWSVYCGISNISITSGRKCVLLPIKKSNFDEYAPYSPATLPIFGEYDDYGGLENIEKNDATKMLEDHFKCTIEQFSYFFTRGCISDDEEDFPKFLKKNQEVKEWNFMFIDREVYDFLGSYSREGYYGKGYFDLGDPIILKLLGFQYQGENENDQRYKSKWSLNGVDFVSDDSYIKLIDKPNGIFTIQELEKYVQIPKENLWLKEKFENQLWKYFPREQQIEKLLPIMGLDRHYITNLGMLKFLKEDKDKEFWKKDFPKGILKLYVDNIEIIGDELVNLNQLKHNLYSFSQFFKPYQLYITPQCGKFKEHQVILEKFCEINKAIMIDHGYDDE